MGSTYSDAIVAQGMGRKTGAAEEIVIHINNILNFCKI